MITAIDSSVLVDIFQKEPSFFESSAVALRACGQAGSLVVCEIVLAELAAAFTSRIELDMRLESLHVEFLPMTREAACLAGKQWKEYRARGGSRKRLIADFLIASHAQEQCDQLLTRDRGFYRSCFQDLVIVNPGG